MGTEPPVDYASKELITGDYETLCRLMACWCHPYIESIRPIDYICTCVFLQW